VIVSSLLPSVVPGKREGIPFYDMAIDFEPVYGQIRSKVEFLLQFRFRLGFSNAPKFRLSAESQIPVSVKFLFWSIARII
jgi:hypothetical protein